MTDSFSTWLRKERERQNISIASIAASTKIKASLFEGLERGDVSQWPAGIYRRSFVRAYAEAIKLDPETVCRKFAEQFPDAGEVARAVGEAAVEPVSAAAVVAASEESRPSSFRLTLAEVSSPFRGGQFLARRDRRLKAMAWDAGSLFAIAATAFVVFGVFWMPLAVATMVYYLGGILVLGNSPGVCIFAPKPPDEGATRSTPGEQSPDRHAALTFEPPMHPLDVVSADQLITSPGQRVHPHPALHERIELQRPQARA